MNIATQILETTMPELRSRYASRLRAQTSELLEFISDCQRGKLTAEVCDEARTLAHSLCGTGSTFGFPEISSAARYLETAIDCGPPHNAKSYVDLTLKLIRACDPAIGGGAAPPVEAEQPAVLGDGDPQLEGLELPLHPFFGSMGVAPPRDSGRVSSNPPSIHAGNLDNKEFVAGTTLFIPVHTPGALFEVGDGHAAQGDGEVDQTAIEASLRVGACTYNEKSSANTRRRKMSSSKPR